MRVERMECEMVDMCKKMLILVLCLVLVDKAADNKIYANQNNEREFITRAELQTMRGNVNDAYKNIYENLDCIISEGIEAELAGRESYGVEDYVYPVGTIIVSNIKPNFGVWIEVDNGSGALYMNGQAKSIKEEGFAEQWATRQNIKLANVTMPQHLVTFNPASGMTSEAGQHTHTANWYRTASDGTNVSKQGTIMGVKQTISLSKSGDHTHKVTLSYEVSSKKHDHHLEAKEDEVYKEGNMKIQPDAYIVKLWKRIK